MKSVVNVKSNERLMSLNHVHMNESLAKGISICPDSFENLFSLHTSNIYRDTNNNQICVYDQIFHHLLSIWLILSYVTMHTHTVCMCE